MGQEGFRGEIEYANILPDEENLKAGLYGLVDFSRPVFYFPVRHHSPVCSFFLKKAIEEYAPDCILIEGPEDANELKDVLVSKELKTPVAIYYSFRDKKGVIRGSGENETYRCYYPFLDYSPELVALREADRRKIPASFFDLGYAEILLATAEGRGLRKDSEKVNYNDDSYLSESTFLNRLVEHAGLPSFDAFWEKYFEIGALSGNLEDFLKAMLLYCGLCRATAPHEDLVRDGCLAREAHMRERIGKASKEYKKVLVVTGGFHTPGLAFYNENADLFGGYKAENELLQSIGKQSQTTTEQSQSTTNQSDRSNRTLTTQLPQDDKGVYVMPYSMEAADALNGYASGMPFPAFYQSIWENLNNPEITDAYTPVVLDNLVKVGKTVRRKDGATSTADEIAALVMAENLAKLRGKEAPGAFELWDAVLSSFVKGELSLASSLPVRELRKALTGSGIGKLPANAKLPPLVHDFEEKCRLFRLDIHSTVKKEVTLQIFANDRHRKESAFFHCMVFLGSDFATRKRGPNLHTGMDRNLIREIWEYKWSTALSGVLIENSVFGGTVEEACNTLAGKRMTEAKDSAEAGSVLLSAFEMGLEVRGDLIGRLQEIVQADSDFFSLTSAFSSVNRLDRLSALYRSGISFAELKDTLFGKLLSLLPGMADLKDEDLERMLSALRELYYEADRMEDLLDVLRSLVKAEKIHPGLLGAVQGILYSAGEMEGNVICYTARGFMNGTGEERTRIAPYLRGLFYTARDILFSSEELIEMMDGFLGEVGTDDFLKLLPQLRLAFGSFTPRETDRIAERVATRYGIEGESLREVNIVSAAGFEYGRGLDERIVSLMKDTLE